MIIGNLFLLVAYVYSGIGVDSLSLYISLNVVISAILARLIATVIETYEDYVYQKRLAEVEEYIERMKAEKEEQEKKKWESVSVDDIVDALTTLGKEHIVEEK